MYQGAYFGVSNNSVNSNVTLKLTIVVFIYITYK